MTGVQILLKLSLLTFIVGSMLAAGLGLAPRQLVVALQDRRLIVTALVLNFLAAPLLAVLLTRLLPLAPGHAIGLILLGCAAGAPFLPKLAEVARCDAATSVALMTLLSLGTLLFMPLALPHLAPRLATDAWSIARSLLLLILLPLGLGLGFAALAPAAAPAARRFLGRLSSLAVLVFLVAVLVRDALQLGALVGTGALLAATLFTVGMLALGRAAGGPQPGTRAVQALAASGRNVGAALVPTTTSADHTIVTMLVASTLVILLLMTAAAFLLRCPPTPGPSPHAPA